MLVGILLGIVCQWWEGKKNGEGKRGGERGNEAEGRKGKKEKDGRDVIIARLAAARVRP
jgi:hypothetical protein